MKSFFLFPLVVVFSVSANAVPLDQLLNQQAITKITPVEFQGAPLRAEATRELDAAKVCGMISNPRLVSYKVKEVNFQKGDFVAEVWPGPGYMPLPSYSLKVKTFAENVKITIFEEISCAR